VPIRKSAGGSERTLGRGTHGSEDEKLPVAEAGARCSVGIRRVDTGQALPAFAVHRIKREEMITLRLGREVDRLVDLRLAHSHPSFRRKLANLRHADYALV